MRRGEIISAQPRKIKNKNKEEENRGEGGGWSGTDRPPIEDDGRAEKEDNDCLPALVRY